MDDSNIDRLYNEHRQLIDFLLNSNELSLLNNVDEQFRKTLLLSASSYFELKICEFVLNHFSEKSNNEETVIAFVKNKAIERQYHTFFSWRDRNANQFFGLFGSAFKTFMIAKVRSDNKLKIAIEAFMELGELRNSIVHRDYATFPLDKTVDEIYSLYRKALFFVLSIPLELRRFSDPAFSSK